MMTKKRTGSNLRLACALGCLLALPVSQAVAYNLVDNEQYQLDLDVEGLGGYFHSQEQYDPFGLRDFPNGVTQPADPADAGSSTWYEGYVRYGFSGSMAAGSSRFYGKINMESSAAFDAGDAAGFQNGHERRNRIEDMYVGWKSGDTIPWLGHDGLDLSAGRQPLIIGNGFLVATDALNLGKGIFNGAANRGGGFWLAARQSFHDTAVARIGGDSGLRADLIWLKSHNAGQSNTEAAIGNLEYVRDYGTFGFTHIKTVDTDEAPGVKEFLGGEGLNPQREGMKTSSVRFIGNAGIEDLSLAAEYAWQKQTEPKPGNANHENAWYGQAGWQFSALPLAPKISYRHSEYSSQYDALFYGNTDATLGTWFQGEVAGNYAGPLSQNAKIDMVQLDLFPAQTVFVGLLHFNFKTKDKAAGPNIDAHETDLYAAWSVNDHFDIIPVIGFYKPKKSRADGGTQIGSNHTNIYTQLLVAYHF